MEGSNEALQDTLGGNAIQAAYESNLDVSPDTAAERVVSSSVQNFPVFQELHPDLTQDEVLTAFVDMISESVETVSAEAKEVLNSLNALQSEDNASMIDETLALVHEKLQLFVDGLNTPETDPITE